MAGRVVQRGARLECDVSDGLAAFIFTVKCVVSGSGPKCKIRE